jgi:hypothetical protein
VLLLLPLLLLVVAAVRVVAERAVRHRCNTFRDRVLSIRRLCLNNL